MSKFLSSMLCTSTQQVKLQEHEQVMTLIVYGKYEAVDVVVLTCIAFGGPRLSIYNILYMTLN
jgi:hypothetical protein